VSTSASFSPEPPDWFEQFQRFISRAKIIVVEVAGLIGLIFLVYEGLKNELRW
jgi:hypothetical protein